LQRLAANMWADAKVGAALGDAARIYRERAGALVAALAVHGIEAWPSSGLNVWIPIAHEAHVVQALGQDGWAVAPGAPYRLRAGPAIRVTTSTLTPAEASKLAESIVAAVEPSTRTRTA
jgi:DNA-binding transcriptional MocR family regulator